jgi:hypothetical protein
MTLERGRGPGGQTSNLVDILDRVLDKGLVVAGDIRIGLANVELLTIQIRLLICSIDKAEQIGMNWWRYNDFLTKSPSPTELAPLLERLESRLTSIEQRLETVAPIDDHPGPAERAD